MTLRLLRQIFSVLLVVTYISATVIAIAPLAMASGMKVQADQMGGMDMPCKSKNMKSNCVTDAGCIFMLSLPAPHFDIGTPLAWAFVTFSMATESVPDHSIKPPLGPPISRA